MHLRKPPVYWYKKDTTHPEKAPDTDVIDISMGDSFACSTGKKALFISGVNSMNTAMSIM